MSEPVLIDRQRALLHDLARLAAEKAEREPALAQGYCNEIAEANRALEEWRAVLRGRFEADRDSLEREWRLRRNAIESRYTAEQEGIEKDHGEARLELINQLDAEAEATEAAFQEARWAADAMLEASRNAAAARLRDNSNRLAARMEELQALHKEARAQLLEWDQPVAEMEEQAARTQAPASQPLRKVTDCVKEAQGLVEEIHDLSVPRYRGKRLLFLLFLLWLGLVFPLGWLSARLVDLSLPLPKLAGVGAGASVLVALLVGVVARAVLRSMARKQVKRLYLPLCAVLVQAEATRQHLVKRYQIDHDQAVQEAQQRYTQDMARARAKHLHMKDIGERRSAGAERLDALQEEACEASLKRREDDLAAAEQRRQHGHAEAQRQYQADQQKLESDHRAHVEQLEQRYAREWRGLVEKWQQTLTAARQSVAVITAESDALFPAWEAPNWADWQPPATQAPVIRVGSYRVEAETVVAAAPWLDARPAPEPISLTLPSLCAFPEPASLLFHVHDDGRDRAVEALRLVMFRLLTSVPPGRVRFTIVDPVGLGQNFAAFMNLADYDEALVGSRIWTESVHIEQRLADLTAHMENVIQKYLRNRYATISEYNTHAGEVAEPFRVLVVANFPTNFTPEAARRLVSIAQSGPRCGVSTLLSIDSRQELPRGFDLADLEACGANLLWQDGRFRWRDEDFGPHPLTLDALPGEPFCNGILQKVGEAARGAHRVEVPFEFIAAPPEQWWSGSSRQGISVPLGRAGATRRQHLELGKGTSQHALIVGKTGSGKSTLLHALITNLALLYSPDEIELYLVDFKKGVEFKTYAAGELAHARVVAIESEREFGLSVLQRLDTELKLRGERFRAAGAQDLNAYRQAVPEARSPRILLIVDEFQEFFTEDDRLAQEAAQLLDRLVRQGRAFGMHVLLGSQTIGGAYSLARATIDQMAVRIALQCSEADAHLVLSEDNSAARLLSRPGEAIYNDANGLVEGNDPFQVVWLDEARREHYLGEVRMLTQQRRTKERPASVIFEGNADADVSRNHLLNRLLSAGPAVSGDDDPLNRVEEAWLGEAMAIDVLTSAGFRRHNGSNLLIVGQQAEAALGMLATGVISLAAHGRAGVSGDTVSLPRFWVVDGHQPGAPRGGVLARLPEVVPEPVRLAGWQDVPGVLAELSVELERRQKTPGADAPSIYLVLYGIQRMRALRRQEDDFGFGSRAEEPPSPDKQLATLLREGAALGMHVLLWCDTLNNLQRAVDRQAMRELALRVVFQLNVTDSSHLIDSPAASRLGLHRALFVNEEEGRLEKFRPYGVPPGEWLAWVREQLRRRGVLATTAATSGLRLVE
jgi:hypothetical protein